MAAAVVAVSPTAAHAQTAKPTPATSCIEIGHGKEGDWQTKEHRFLRNRCPRKVELSWCLPGAASQGRCGATKKFYWWNTVLEPGQRMFNDYSVPDQGTIAMAVCFGNYGSTIDVSASGAYDCKPPRPAPLELPVDFPCGEKTVKASIRIEYLPDSVKMMEIRAGGTRSVFGARTIRGWKASSVPSVVLTTIPVKSHGAVVGVPLTVDRVRAAVCSTKQPPASGFVDRLRKELRRALGDPQACRPVPGVELPTACTRKTHSAGPGVRG